MESVLFFIAQRAEFTTTKSVKNKSTKNGLISVLQDALHPNRKTTSEFSEILIFLYAFKAKQKY